MMNARIFAFLRRSGTLLVGHTTNQVMVFVGDYIIYPAVIWSLGPFYGGITMIVVSFTLCWGTLVAYDFLGRDWLGIEMVKAFRDEGVPENVLAKIFSWCLRRGDWVSMIALSIQTDPFVTTVYMRKGANAFNGLSARDWKIFVGSIVIANLYWTVIVSTGISLGRLFFSSN